MKKCNLSIKMLHVVMLTIVFFFTVYQVLLAKEIKPGVTITKENYGEYLAELKNLLDPCTFVDLTIALERGDVTVPVVEYQEYPQAKAYYEATKKHSGNCKVDPANNQLIGWVAGQPFPRPKNGAELAWNLDRKCLVGDQYHFVADWYLFNRKGEQERSVTWHYWHLYYTGRTRNKPTPEVPGNNGLIRWKGQFTMLNPFDIKGYSCIRTRFEDVSKSDETFSYIPTIRRVRRMTGADVCDPILGTDLIMEDFELFMQKISGKMTFEMSEKLYLVPSYDYKFTPPFKSDFKGGYRQRTWQIRPVYVLTINCNDPAYIYSKRVLIMEKQRQLGGGYYTNTYDTAGRPYRYQLYTNAIVDDPPWYSAWSWGTRVKNVLTNHWTQFIMGEAGQPWKINDDSMSPDQFNFKWLLRKAR